MPPVATPVGRGDEAREKATGVEVKHIERWLKDVSAALEREQQATKDTCALQSVRVESTHMDAGSMLSPLHEVDDGTKSPDEANEQEALAQRERLQVRVSALKIMRRCPGIPSQ